MSATILNVEQIGTDTDNEIDQFEIGDGRPTGIVEGRPSKVVADLEGDLRFEDEELHDGEQLLATGQMEERFPKLIAALEQSSFFMILPEQVDIAIPDGANHVKGVGFNFGGGGRLKERLRNVGKVAGLHDDPTVLTQLGNEKFVRMQIVGNQIPIVPLVLRHDDIGHRQTAAGWWWWLR